MSCRIGDIEAMRFVDDDATLASDTSTPQHATPELWSEEAKCSSKVDGWSVELVVAQNQIQGRTRLS
jgi:hypothetical protein